MDYSVQAYNLALKLKYTLGIIDAMIERSNDYTLTGQLDSALVLSQKAIRMSDSIKNDKRRADSYSMHAGILYEKEDLQLLGNIILKLTIFIRKLEILQDI